MNRIIDNEEIANQFIDWATDHYNHFNCYPGSFVSYDGEHEIEFTEEEIWEALNELFDI